MPRRTAAGGVCWRNWLLVRRLASSGNWKPGQKACGACVIRKRFFFTAELGGVRFSPAADKSDGMLHVQHFVIEDVRHDVIRDVLVIQLAIEHDLVQCRIETSQLSAPNTRAPS